MKERTFAPRPALLKTIQSETLGLTIRGDGEVERKPARIERKIFQCGFPNCGAEIGSVYVANTPEKKNAIEHARNEGSMAPSKWTRYLVLPSDYRYNERKRFYEVNGQIFDSEIVRKKRVPKLTKLSSDAQPICSLTWEESLGIAVEPVVCDLANEARSAGTKVGKIGRSIILTEEEIREKPVLVCCRRCKDNEHLSIINTLAEKAIR